MTPRAQCPTPLPGPLTAVVTPEELERTLREAREGLQRLRRSLSAHPADTPGRQANSEDRKVLRRGAPEVRPDR